MWVRAPVKPDAVDKAAIARACEAFVADAMKPRFLPEVRPREEFNFPVDIYGKWHGANYRFIQRWRTPHGEEFEAAYARLEYRGRDRFDIGWHRHTGQWFTLHRGVTLAEALRLMKTDGHLHPP